MSLSAAPTVRRFSVGTAGDRITRDQLVAWISGRLESPNVASFEELSSGEAYWTLALLFTSRPGSLRLGKAKCCAKREHDRVHNFRLLQQGLDKACVRREFRIEVLIASRFRHHYELLTWFRRLFDEAHADRDADAAERACAAKAPAAPAALGLHPDAARPPTAEPHDEMEEIRRTRQGCDQRPGQVPLGPAFHRTPVS